MRANQEQYSVRRMCRLLGVSASSYYVWLGRPRPKRAEQDESLLAKIRFFHQRSRGTYGAPRIHLDLIAQGIRVSPKRVARLMREAGLEGVSRRRRVRTTVRNRQARPAPDLVQRQFSARGKDQLWVADITYIPTLAGFLYLAVVMDVWSRRIVGWAMECHLRTEIVLKALEMALQQRRPRGVIHHSDQGTQYTALAFGQRCQEAGVRPSMGSVGDCYDNAMCESFFATLECELLDRHRFANQREARRKVFDFIEGWYNRHRRHSGVGGVSPMVYEQLKLDSKKGRETQPATRFRRTVVLGGVAPQAPQEGSQHPTH